jgi:hypothetical protein
MPMSKAEMSTRTEPAEATLYSNAHCRPSLGIMFRPTKNASSTAWRGVRSVGYINPVLWQGVRHHLCVLDPLTHGD